MLVTRGDIVECGSSDCCELVKTDYCQLVRFCNNVTLLLPVDITLIIVLKFRNFNKRIAIIAINCYLWLIKAGN